MSNLEVKDTISAWQLSLLLAANMIAASIITMKGAVFGADQYSWISCFFGGVLYSGCAWLMLRLGQCFPGESFIGYMPKAAGKIVGHFAIIYVLLLWTLVFIYITRGFANVITFYMFDSTPVEVVAIIMLIISAYCSVQDFGTVLRVIQFFIFTIFPINIIIWYSILLNFQIINVLPLMPYEGYANIVREAVRFWMAYGGYELILLFLPFVHRGEINLSKAVFTAMGFITVFYTVGIFVLIGVVSIGTIQHVPYPSITAIKSIELPGTFIERLENYMLLSWIPLVFQTTALTLFSLVWSLKQYFKFADHRPFVPLLSPFLFLGISLLERIEVFNKLAQLINYMGMVFSLVLIPAVLLAVWWRRRNAHAGS